MSGPHVSREPLRRTGWDSGRDPRRLLFAAGAGILLASPRHRARYYGEPPAVVAPAAVLAGVAAVGSGKGAVSDALALARSYRGSRAHAAAGQGAPPLDGQEFAGHASIELCAPTAAWPRLASERARSRLPRRRRRAARVPVLSWTWKVTSPAGGDVRDAARDDQAAQSTTPALAFARTRATWWATSGLSRAPVGTRSKPPRANVRIVVVESGGRGQRVARLRAQRAADYAALFRPPAARVASWPHGHTPRHPGEERPCSAIWSRPDAPEKRGNPPRAKVTRMTPPDRRSSGARPVRRNAGSIFAATWFRRCRPIDPAVSERCGALHPRRDETRR